MNTGQTLLAVGAMILLSVLILRVNGTFLTTGTTIMNTKFDILATSIAISELEEISRRRFDEYTVHAPATSLTQLSTTLGREGGEPAPPNDSSYDDIDDYNNFYKDITDMPSANFHVLCHVNYVQPNALDDSTTVPTWFKKVTVEVWPKLKDADTVRISQVFSYWN